MNDEFQGDSRRSPFLKKALSRLSNSAYVFAVERLVLPEAGVEDRLKAPHPGGSVLTRMACTSSDDFQSSGSIFRVGDGPVTSRLAAGFPQI
jgi:hypothetical protein